MNSENTAETIFGSSSNVNKKPLQLIRLEDAVKTSTVIDIKTLKELVWLGVPKESDPCLRALVWKLLLGYLPLERNRQEASVKRKEQEYKELRELYVESATVTTESTGMRSTTPPHVKQYRQIRVDLCRTRPPGFTIVFAHSNVQRMMERVLLVWAIRNPASGYVQGLNDLVTPLIIVFLQEALNLRTLKSSDLDQISDDAMLTVEAASYWCLSKILLQVQDNFVFGQPGIVRMINGVANIVKRIDAQLFEHLHALDINLLQVCFRWMNCFLTRELPLLAIIRLWDTYIAEGTSGFSEFHIYVSAVYWSHRLKAMDYQQILLFLQGLPTENWSSQEIESLVAEAFVLKSLFHSSPKHLLVE